jgi:hypothetical protein
MSLHAGICVHDLHTHAMPLGGRGPCLCRRRPSSRAHPRRRLGGAALPLAARARPAQARRLRVSLLHASSMHVTCVLHASYMRLTCVLHARYMHVSYTFHARYMHVTCTLHARNMHVTCICELLEAGSLGPQGRRSKPTRPLCRPFCRPSGAKAGKAAAAGLGVTAGRVAKKGQPGSAAAKTPGKRAVFRKKERKKERSTPVSRQARRL